MREGSARERAIALAGMLGEHCRSCADDVSGLFVGKLSQLLAASTPSQRPQLLVHGRGELLLRMAAEKGPSFDAAVREAIDEVQTSLGLAVPLMVEVVELGGAWG